MKNKIAFCFFFMLAGFSCMCGTAQVINTLAGIGPLHTLGSYSGDNAPAILAGLGYPIDVAVDKSGNVYIADDNNNRVRKVNAAGIITTICGNGTAANTGDGGPASAAEIIGPTGIAADKNGNIYLALSTLIRKIDTAGVITTIAGTGVSGYSGDGGPATAADIEGAGLVGIDDSGNVYICGLSFIRKINTSGSISLFAGSATLLGFSGDGGPATAALLNSVHGIAADKVGNVYFCDDGNERVRKINAAGIITTLAGTGMAGYSGDGGPATAAKIDVALNVATDTFGNVYISDSYNSVIRKVDTSGVITTIAGNHIAGYSGDGGPSTAAELGFPHGIVVAENGIIYIADNYENRVRVISYNLYFASGKYQAATICAGNALGLDTMLAANDSNVGVAEYWMPLAGPYHGTALATYSATTTGGTVYPSGLSYTPSPGFSGVDTLVVRITDAAVSDTTTIYLNVVPRPVTGAITGPDTLCRGDSVLLSDTTAGGSWSASNGNVTVSAGMVRGMSAGTDTLSYVVMNMCGPDTVSHLLTVKLCPSLVNPVSPPDTKIEIYPNPAAGAFTFSLPEPYDEAIKIIITNPVGEKVQEINALTNSPTEIQISGPPGIYFINAVTAHGVWSEKVVINK